MWNSCRASYTYGEECSGVEDSKYSHTAQTCPAAVRKVTSFIEVSPPLLRSLYNEPLTPSSNPSLSPGGSPLREGPLERSTLPSPADWSEFINASNSKVERDLAQLTLSDPEQRELYEAARLVQTAFRKYKVQAWHSGVVCCVHCSEGVGLYVVLEQCRSLL